MLRSVRSTFIFAFACFCALLLLPSASARADDTPIPILSTFGKTGAFAVVLKERSPLSAPAEIAKRMLLPAEALKDDYNLSDCVFDVYVPKSPGEGGKYGLMTVLPFMESHGAPPTEWPEVLEKHHIVWIGPRASANGKPPVPRVGQVLDAIYNAKKIWPVDDARVYLCLATFESPVSGTALYYPDVFQGAFHTVTWGAWMTKIRSANGGFWETPNAPLPKPASNLLTLARRNRYFLASRKSGSNTTYDRDVLNRGYLAEGFTHAKMIEVPEEAIGHWVNYGGSWFDEGVQFLDVGIPRRAAKAPVASSSGPATAPSAPDAQAAKLLSMARNYIAIKHYDAARKKLQAVVASYPNSPASKEAQDLLTQIADQ